MEILVPVPLYNVKTEFLNIVIILTAFFIFFLELWTKKFVFYEMFRSVAGELRCVEVELSNTGPVGAGNIHLVSRTPGLLSFGKKTNAETGSLYEFPLVERNQAPLRLVQEDGTVSQARRIYVTIMFILTILTGLL